MKKILPATPALLVVLLTTACGGPSSPAPATTAPASTPTSFAAASPGEDTSTQPLAAPTLAPADVRTKAAAVPRTAHATWRAEYEKGTALTGTARTDWWTTWGALPVRLAAANTQAFSDADHLFTADDEPTSINDWNDAFGELPGDVQAWYNSDRGHGYDPALQAKVEADFTAADQQAANVSDGK